MTDLRMNNWNRPVVYAVEQTELDYIWFTGIEKH